MEALMVLGGSSWVEEELQQAERWFLREADGELRAVLLMGISGSEGATVERLLTRALQDPEAEVRTLALAGLGDLELELREPLLQAVRTDPAAQVRKAALRQIGMDSQAVQAVLDAATGDAEPQVREEAVRLLGSHASFREKAGVADLLRHIEGHDSSLNVRKMARMGLRRLAR
jgi:HEAT repeat protein